MPHPGLLVVYLLAPEDSASSLGWVTSYGGDGRDNKGYPAVRRLQTWEDFLAAVGPGSPFHSCGFR